MGNILLSDEQETFIRYALEGHNIMVNACIGSGKTTAIQELCNRYMKKYKNRKVLYLTYNKLLKLDAKEKIKNKGVLVSNYHGFAYMELKKVKVASGMSDLIQTYNAVKPPCRKFHLLVIDEYQDIEEELAQMLSYIKRCNSHMQIIAVGDMEQKIYDKTKLDVQKFMQWFLGPSQVRLEFTKCFRICKSLAKQLGFIWGKKIDGVNANCHVYNMDFYDIKEYLLKCNPKDILCLGQNAGKRTAMLNELEEECPDKFNKYTVWSNVSDNDCGSTQPSPECAVFTTYDGCKGMERNICVVFDWTESYWAARTQKPNAKYEIIRNIFCVAASRGKHIIIFEKDQAEEQDKLSMNTIMGGSEEVKHYDDVDISTMFDFKYIEDIESAYRALKTREIKKPDREIKVSTSDGMIDLTTCIGIYQEAAYFNGYDIEAAISQYFAVNRDKEGRKLPGWQYWKLEQQILYLTALETNQDRYMKQVDIPFIGEKEWMRIAKRLSSEFTQDERAQEHCQIEFLYDDGNSSFTACGMCDVIKGRKDGKWGEAVYELKFVGELSHVHFLQCACYMVAFSYEVGYLYNTFNDQMYEIRIPDRKAFMDRVVRAITKGHVTEYKGSVSLEKYTGKEKQKRAG